MKRLSRLLLTVCGVLCVALAFLGMVLPLLPTTPFLLLAAVCFARSSPRFYHWLLNNRWFGPYIRNYREGRGVSLRHKAAALVLLWLTIGYAVGFVVSHWWARLLLLAVAAAVTVHLLKLKTYKPQTLRNDLPANREKIEEAV